MNVSHIHISRSLSIYVYQYIGPMGIKMQRDTPLDMCELLHFKSDWLATMSASNKNTPEHITQMLGIVSRKCDNLVHSRG